MKANLLASTLLLPGKDPFPLRWAHGVNKEWGGYALATCARPRDGALAAHFQIVPDMTDSGVEVVDMRNPASAAALENTTPRLRSAVISPVVPISAAKCLM